MARTPKWMLIPCLRQMTKSETDAFLDSYVEYCGCNDVHKRGPKLKWSGWDGLLLVLAVEEQLLATKSKVWAAIEEMPEDDRELWGGYATEDLRVRFHEAKRHIERFFKKYRIS